MKQLFIRSFLENRELCWRLTEREVLGRYRGSALGIAWVFINPLAMLTVYTFVFSQVFVSRWGGMDQAGPLGFAVNLFAGLIVYNLFSECISRAPGLVVSNPNYVKKVIFPLEVLMPVTIGASLFHAGCSLLILLAFQLLLSHHLSPTFLFLPLVWLPFLLGTLGLGWFFSMLGVFL